jgi:hypothetical protein
MNTPYDQDSFRERGYIPKLSTKTVAKLATVVVVVGLGTINDRPAFEIASDPAFYGRLAGELGTTFNENVLGPIVEVASDTSRW